MRIGGSSSFPKLLVILLAAAVLSGCGHDESPFAREAHSVVLIDIGGASAEALERFSSDGSATENLGASTARFDFTFAQSSEPRPAMASLLTGLYPGTHGVKAADNRLDDTIVTLPQAFQEAGFATAAFSTAGDLGAGSGLDRGFEQSTQATGDKLASELRSFLDRNARKPFFLLLHTDLSYALGSSEREAKLQQRIEAFDLVVKLLEDELVARGLSESTTRLLTSDRGIDLGTARVADDDDELHNELFDELASTRVPLLLATPGLVDDRELSDSIEIVDVMPTLLDLAGVEVPGLVQGVSLRRLLEGSAQERFIAFSQLRSRNDDTAAAVSLAGFQLVRVGSEPPQLFDLRAGTATDIAALEPHKVEVLQRHLDSWLERMASGLAGAQIIGNDELDALQDLGYIQ